MPEQSTIQSTTQQFLDIYDITNDVVILKNGAASVILSINAINFGLLAEEEQDAVIYQYAALLNSLNFPIQVVVRSQTKDATSYLQLLKDREDQTSDRVKREWIRRYREFVSNLIYERNVLDKKFYVAIPASYLEMGLTPTQNLVSGFKEATIEGVEKSVILEKALNLLEPRRDHLIGQFARIGLLARQLKTQEIIQLFYTSYNPEAAEGQQITDSSSYTTPLVQAQIRGVLMNDQPTNPILAVQPAQIAQSPMAPTAGPASTTPAVETPVVPPTPTTTPSVNSPTPPQPVLTESPGTLTPIESPSTIQATQATPPSPTPPTSSISSTAASLPAAPTTQMPSTSVAPMNPTVTITSPASSSAPSSTPSSAPTPTSMPTTPSVSMPTPAPITAPTATPAPINPPAPLGSPSSPGSTSPSGTVDAEAQALINSAAQQVSVPEEEAATPDLSTVQPVIKPPTNAT